MYKAHLVEGRAPAGPAVDSARANLAATFVNAFVNAGFGTDKLLTNTSVRTLSKLLGAWDVQYATWFSTCAAAYCTVDGHKLVAADPGPDAVLSAVMPSMMVRPSTTL